LKLKVGGEFLRRSGAMERGLISLEERSELRILIFKINILIIKIISYL